METNRVTMEINIEGKNTMEILETPTGVTIVLKSSKSEKPKLNEHYWYVAFNAIRGFFEWENIWFDSEMDNCLLDAGNCFSTKGEANEISTEFNMRLKVRLK